MRARKNGLAFAKASVLLVSVLLLGALGYAARAASPSSSSSSSSYSASPLSSSLWVWYDVLGKGLGGKGEHSIWTDPTKFDEIINFLSSSKGLVRNVLIQAQGHLGDEQSIALATDFVSRCHYEANTSVSFTFGWSKSYVEATGYWSVSDATAEALNFTDNVVKFSQDLRKNMPDVPEVGLHFDVEPNPADDQQYQQLADLLVAIDQRVTTAKLVSGVSVEWSSTSSFLFASKMVNCGVVGSNTNGTTRSVGGGGGGGRAKTSLMQCLAKTSDVNLLMGQFSRENRTHDTNATHDHTACTRRLLLRSSPYARGNRLPELRGKFQQTGWPLCPVEGRG